MRDATVAASRPFLSMTMPARTMDTVAESVLDLRGLFCPQPVLRTKRALRSIAVGDTLVLKCTDPLTVIDVPHFVRQTRHALTEQSRQDDLYIFKIIKQH